MNNLKIGLAILLVAVGASIGYLLGLSEAPVIQATLATILGAVISVTGALSVATSKVSLRNQVASIACTALLVIGMPLGASTGIYVRDHGVLSGGNSARGPRQEAEQAKASESQAKPSVLHSASIADSDELKAISEQDGVALVNRLELSTNPLVRDLVAPLHGKEELSGVETKMLRAIKKVILDSSKS